MDLSNRLNRYEAAIIKVGIFILFVVTFGDYVLKKVLSVIGSWFP